jgi:hypothetical protein
MDLNEEDADDGDDEHQPRDHTSKANDKWLTMDLNEENADDGDDEQLELGDDFDIRAAKCWRD